MLKHLLSIAALVFLSLPLPALAIAPVKVISSEQARGQSGSLPIILVWPGSGTNLNFLPTGERIQRVWLDDPSRITLDFDSPLCQSRESRNCAASSASIIHLKRIHPINWPGLPKTDATLLTVVTEGPAGRQLYQFQVAYGTGKPQYTTLEVKTGGSGITATHGSSDLRQIERGVKVAIERQLIQPGSPLAIRLSHFLRLTRSGTPIPSAAQQAGISLALVQKLASLGG